MTSAYLGRFIGNITKRTYNAVYPEKGKASKVVMVLPDEWKYANEDMLEKMGVKDKPVGATSMIRSGIPSRPIPTR